MANITYTPINALLSQRKRVLIKTNWHFVHDPYDYSYYKVLKCLTSHYEQYCIKFYTKWPWKTSRLYLVFKTINNS